jgi:hypothetical protein
MNTRLYAHASMAAAVLLTIGACYTATLDAWWPALGGLFPAGVLAWNAHRCYTQARREQAVQQRLTRLTRDKTEPFVPRPPCCSFWRHTSGQMHGPDCTRPATARTALTPAEEAAFAQIAAEFHRTGGQANP